MKGFISTLIVVCLIIGGVWFAYEPYIKPLLDKEKMPAPTETLIGDKTAPVAEPKAASEGMVPKKTGSTVATPAAAPAPKAETKSEIDLIIEEKYPMPDFIPLEEIVDGWRNVPQRAFPPEVIAEETIAFQLVVGGQVIGSSNVASGTPLTPQSLSGDQLVIANAANPGMSTTISVDKTDFKERITNRYNEYVGIKRGEITAKRARVKQVIEADPTKLAALTGEAAPVVATDPGNPNLAPVKASLQAGDVASVTLEEATAFAWNGSETVRGKFAGTYDTVTVSFEVSTIFGTFPVRYKCLLQGGRVVAWIDPITEDPV